MARKYNWAFVGFKEWKIKITNEKRLNYLIKEYVYREGIFLNREFKSKIRYIKVKNLLNNERRQF